MQPRIYTYKITFEEVPYYYYGSKKEKKYNQEYWGSPITHKWCWELYTPKKQILELFDYTDEGYEKCRRVEDRLIKPVLNDPWCLNEHCGGTYSLDIKRNSAKRGGERAKELGVGAHGLTKEQRVENGKKYGKIGGKIGGNISGPKTYELGVGVHGLTPEQRTENGKKGAEKCKELGLGISSFTKEQLSEYGKKGGLLAGKISGPKTYELGVGIHGLTPEQKTENAKKGGEMAGKLAKEFGKGIFALTPEQRSENSKKISSQRWMCTKTGYISNAGGLSIYQNKRGIDNSNRIRIL
jgi:hypothetical protein